MRAQGNALPLVCAQNICNTMRGEIAYRWPLGLNPDIIDAPTNVAYQQIKDDLSKQLQTFEPRINPDKINFEMSQLGDGAATVLISEVSGNE